MTAKAHSGDSHLVGCVSEAGGIQDLVQDRLPEVSSTMLCTVTGV